jgi:hypothetical protein
MVGASVDFRSRTGKLSGNAVSSNFLKCHAIRMVGCREMIRIGIDSRPNPHYLNRLPKSTIPPNALSFERSKKNF